MSHFAKIENNIVTQVIVADQEFIDSGAVGDPVSWIQTSYNGRIRKTYAGIGYSYNQELDAFISPKPYDSWVLNTETATWEAPVTCPIVDGVRFVWNENNLNWEESQHPLPAGEV